MVSNRFGFRDSSGLQLAGSRLWAGPSHAGFYAQPIDSLKVERLTRVAVGQIRQPDKIIYKHWRPDAKNVLLLAHPVEVDRFRIQVVANYFGSRQRFDLVSQIHWPGGFTDAPPDIPKCGFDGSGCPPDGQL